MDCQGTTYDFGFISYLICPELLDVRWKKYASDVCLNDYPLCSTVTFMLYTYFYSAVLIEFSLIVYGFAGKGHGRQYIELAQACDRRKQRYYTCLSLSV